jgi:lipid II:glycine glycyltransferase (peptidoglycan interpeptide bridge formation enzyme)
MIEKDLKLNMFTIKSIWFSDYPFDIYRCSCVRFYACKNKVDFPGFTRIDNTTLVIDLTQELDILFMNMSRNTRRVIKKPMLEELTLEKDEHQEEFIQMAKDFRKKLHLEPLYLTKEFLNSDTCLYVATYRREVISGNLFLIDKNEAYWYCSVSKRLSCSREKANIIANANKLIMWEAIKYFKDKGMKELDLGGYHVGSDDYLSNESYSTFKARFGGEIVTKYLYIKNYSYISNLAVKGYRKVNNIIRTSALTKDSIEN